MKGKLIGFALALFSVATLGVVQLQSEAAGHPSGKVGNAPVCEAHPIGQRGDTSVDLTTQNAPRLAYDVNNGVATVKFKVTGPNNCKVRLSNNSFWAPSQNGRPYERQILYQRTTKVFTPGRYTMSVRVPTQPRNGMCFYQVDLTYGTHNVTPVIAYGHGKILGCLPKPQAACKNLSVTKLERTKFRFNGAATVKNGATVRSYTFVVSKAGQVVHRQTSNSPAYTYNATTPGNYSVRLTVNTSVGPKTGGDCVKTFTVTPPPAEPAAVCKDLAVTKLSRTSFRFNGSATVSGGATVSAYVFTVSRGSDVVHTETVSSSALNASYTYTETTPGDYTVKLTVKTSVGDKTSANCEKQFTVTPPPTEPEPGVSIEKTVENQKYKRVGVNVEFEYQIVVTNTGDVDLKDVKVTDTPEEDITLISGSAGTVEDNTWTHTIPELKQGETVEFTLKAKVPVYKAGMLKNTACVDAQEVPGNPDDCDTADVDVPKEPEEPEVPEVPTTPEVVTPTELPTTGPADAALQLIGVASLTSAAAYYVASRRG